MTHSRSSPCCLAVFSPPLGQRPSVGDGISIVWLLVTQQMAPLARSSIFGFLRSAIKVGYLELIDSQGIHGFGTYEEGRNTVRITVKNDLFYVRVLASADLGISESYMMRYIDVNDLKRVMHVCPGSHLSIEESLIHLQLWLDNFDEMVGLDSKPTLSYPVSTTPSSASR